MRVVIGMATMKGRESQVELAVASLEGQAEIRVYDNATRVIDYADNGKFFFLSQYKEPVYYLTCDDDIIYPPTYVADMAKAIDKHGTIVTHHGRILKGVDRSYYRGHEAFRFTHEIKKSRVIDVCGTGVTGFRTDYFNPVDIFRSEYKRMADLVFSLEAAKAGKVITLLPHKEDYFEVIPVDREKTIYGVESNREGTQIGLANEVFRLRSI